MVIVGMLKDNNNGNKKNKPLLNLKIPFVVLMEYINRRNTDAMKPRCGKSVKKNPPKNLLLPNVA